MTDVESHRERQKLKAELAQIERRRSEIVDKIAVLDDDLAPVEHLILALTGASGEPQPVSRYKIPQELPSESPQKRSRRGGARMDTTINAHKVMSEIALNFGRLFPKGFEARDVWATVQDDEGVDPQVKKVTQGYVYVVMRRLISQGLLVKAGTKYLLPQNAPEGEGVAAQPSVDGFKLVPLTKEERIREETTKYLSRRMDKTAHRAAIADFLVSRGIMGQEKKTISNLSVYLVRWPEFQSDGEGNYTYTPPEKEK